MTTIHNDVAHALSLRDSFFAETVAAPLVPPADSFDEHLARAHDAAADPPPAAPSPPAPSNAAAPAATPPRRRDDEKRPEDVQDEEPTDASKEGPATDAQPTDPKATTATDKSTDGESTKEEENNEETKQETADNRSETAAVVPVIVAPIKSEKDSAESKDVPAQAEVNAETPAVDVGQPTATMKGNDLPVEQAKQVVAVESEQAAAVVGTDVVATTETAQAETVEKTAPRATQAAEIVAAVEPKESEATSAGAEATNPAPPVSPLAVRDGQSATNEEGPNEDKSREKRNVSAAAAASVVDETAVAAPEEATAPTPAATTTAPPPVAVAAAAEIALPPVAPEDKAASNAVGAIEGNRRPGTTAHAKDTAPAQRDGQAGVDPARFVQRVANAFRAANDANGTLRLKLSPPELGSLRLEITVQKGAMTARLEAETVETRNLLLDNLPALRERLAQQDIKIQHFQVDLADRRPGSGADQAAEQFRRQDQGHAPPSGNRATRASEITTTAATTSARRVNDNSQLNVIV